MSKQLSQEDFNALCSSVAEKEAKIVYTELRNNTVWHCFPYPKEKIPWDEFAFDEPDEPYEAFQIVAETNVLGVVKETVGLVMMLASDKADIMREGVRWLFPVMETMLREVGIKYVIEMPIGFMDNASGTIH